MVTNLIGAITFLLLLATIAVVFFIVSWSIRK